MSNFNSLKKWLKLENDNLRMYKKDSRGIYSTKDIKKDDIIIRIPSKYIIEFSKIDNNKLSSMLYNKNSYVATYLLLKAQKDTTFWKTYLESMPKTLNEYIYFYSKTKLALLKHTTMMSNGVYNFKNHMKNIVTDSKIIYKWLLQKNLLPEKCNNYKTFFPMFLYFRILVCSRIFGYSKKNKDEIGMVPYADLFNHSENPNTHWYFDDKLDSFIVKSTCDIKKNSEIYDSYGAKTNNELMMYYGFTIKNNINSNLSVSHNNSVYEFDHNSDKISDNHESLKNKLKKILQSHLHNSKKKEHVDNNILNIYNDEITIINKILGK